MSEYPWSVLGLDAPSDEAAIRRAYARRLKVVRPDTDAKGFQELVEARAFALELLRQAAFWAAAEDDDDPVAGSDDASDCDIAAAAGSGAEQLVPTHHADEPDAPAPSLAEPVILHGDPLSVGDVETPQNAAVSVLELALDDIQTPPVPTVLVDHGEVPSPQASREPHPSEPPPSASFGDTKIALEAVLLPRRPWVDPKQAEQTLAVVAEMPQPLRQVLEVDALALLDAAVEPIADDLKSTAPPAGLWSRGLVRLGLQRPPLVELRNSALTRRNFVIALDEIWGWTTADRSVFEALSPRKAERVLTHLIAFRREQKIEREGLPTYRDGDGLPVVDHADFAAYFGSETAHYAGLYQDVRRNRRWVSDWRPFLLLLAPLWALSLSHFGLLGAWFGLLVVAQICVEFLQDSGQWLFSALPKPIAQYLVIGLQALAYLPVLALHVLIARTAYRFQIARLIRLVRRADRRRIFQPIARAAFLRRRSQSFRFKPEKASWNWTGNKWFWIILGIVVVRIIAALAK